MIVAVAIGYIRYVKLRTESQWLPVLSTKFFNRLRATTNTKGLKNQVHKKH